MPRYLSADYIFPVSSEPIKDGVVVLNESGEVIDVLDPNQSTEISEKIVHYQGIIVPGFVNSHCHLELSHMFGKIPEGTGLVSFISAVISQRSAAEDQVLAAMKTYDQLMFANGIVAVGDISNNNLSKSVKQDSRIYYHTFIELLGFDPLRAGAVFQKALDLKAEFAPLSASFAPHAPYSVSDELFSILKKYSEDHDNLFTMHNQESEPENELFLSKSGAFIDFYKMLNLDLSFFNARSKTSLQSLLPSLPDNQKILLVHNTFTSSEDIIAAKHSKKYINWCLCPNANLYIEQRLPDVALFLNSEFNITVGTDSLASNDKLCILSELKIIKEHFSELPSSQIIRWATLNGAQFLGIDSKFGSIEKGKTPGLNLISHVNGTEITHLSQIQRLI
jgi:cytosine/adenosine deaminase-related metal-dependent hydrolase